MHLGIPNWHYAFTQVGLDPQTLQWFRFLSPERLAIDIENRRNQEALARKKNNRNLSANGNQAGNRMNNEKIKVEGLKRKKRRMRLKAKGASENIIEKFIAQSSKSAKYAKTTVKKRDLSEAGKSSAIDVKRLDGPPSAGANPNATPASASGGEKASPNVQATISNANNENARTNTDAASVGGPAQI